MLGRVGRKDFNVLEKEGVFKSERESYFSFGYIKVVGWFLVVDFFILNF